MMFIRIIIILGDPRQIFMVYLILKILIDMVKYCLFIYLGVHGIIKRYINNQLYNICIYQTTKGQ